MKLTNREIYDAKRPLQTLIEEKLPVKVSYGLAKLAAKLDEQLEVIEKVRRGLISTYGAKDPKNPQQVMVSPESENFPKFAEEIEELMAQETEIVIEVVTLPDTLEIQASILMALKKFVKVA